ncbi:MAG: hypothetical protein V7K50_15390 [Nostoc sp.]|uniref:tellurite resistance TerB family protein n=1 Tax=Nostoc sp. TaxID=1180 RepID=UPI002FFD13ED
MELFESIFKFLLLISVGTTALFSYLCINKMWTRKHDPLVAESISPIAMAMWISVSLPFVLNYTLQNNWRVALTYFLRLIFFIVFFLVSIGFWVKDRQHKGIWQKFIKALKQEANESTNLIKALNHPSRKKELLNILYRVAWLDDELNEKEREYIQMFADSWEIDTSYLFNEPPPEKGIEKLNKVREEVIAYLALQPSKEQAQSLSDVVQALINIDERVTKEEELIGAEISGMLINYASQEKTALCRVIIHPTNQKEQESLLALVPSAKEEYILGNPAFIVATFQTAPYAEAFSENYREQGFFTIVQTYNARL